MNFQPALHRSRKRLVLCGRAKDSLVEAIIQVGDDQEEEGSTVVPPHHVLPTMANVVSMRKQISTTSKYWSSVCISLNFASGPQHPHFIAHVKQLQFQK